MLRAAWLAQELLTTFDADLAALELIPSETSGTFQIRVGEDLVWCRRLDQGFPQAAELKRRVRDRVAPGRPLGHSDAKGAENG
jgi:selenoprotein W-related protein